MTSEPRRVAVVIPALDAADTIERQIRAVLADRDDSVEVVLVDNGSTDATLEVMRAATVGHDRVTIVREPRRGVNRARNAGIAASTAPLVLLCDADDEIEPGWIDAMASELEIVDLVGGALRPVDVDGTPVGDAELPRARDPFGWGIPHPWGGSCGVRRSVWERLGGFDPRLSGGGDEADLFLRAQIAGASFTWSERGVVRYTQRPDPEGHARRRWFEGWRNLGGTYWFGRLRGWPRSGNLAEDVAKCVLLLPLAPFSAHWRSVLEWRLARRWGAAMSLLRLPGEIRHCRQFRSTPPARFVPTGRFRRDWRHIDRIDGWLSRAEAAALDAAASRVAPGRAIVEIGSWKGRSTLALALGCRRNRPVYAVDPHMGTSTHSREGAPPESLTAFKETMRAHGLVNVVPVVDHSHSAATAYSGPPIGLLFIDGEHTTDAVIDDLWSWAPHLTPDAMVMFHDWYSPEVRAAIRQLRSSLPPRMLNVENLAIFSAV